MQTWEFSRLESWSRDVLRPVFTSLGLGLRTPRVLVLVLVLDPSSLGLGLGLGTWDSDVFKELHPLLKVFCLPVTSAPVERIFSHSKVKVK